MIAVTAPDGYEACRYYVDRRGWVVAARPSGSTWWTDLGDVGHAHATDAELQSRAESRVACPRLGIVVREHYRLGAP